MLLWTAAPAAAAPATSAPTTGVPAASAPATSAPAPAPDPAPASWGETENPARSVCSDGRPTGVGASGSGPAATPPDEGRDLTVALGDVAVVPLSVPDGATTTVTVEGGNYSATLAVRDDGDGVVRLVVNTYLAADAGGTAPGTYGALGEDSVGVRGVNATGPLAEGSYAVTARRNGSTVDEQSLTVTPPALNGAAAFRAAPRVFDVGSAAELRAANRSGLVRPLLPGEHAPEAVHGEAVVVRFDAPSLLGALAAQPGNSTTERFLALHDRVDPETPESFRIGGLCGGIMFADTVAAGGARVLADHREGAVYVLLDTRTLRGVADGSQRVEFEVDPASRLVASERELRTEFAIRDREVSVDADGGGTVRLSVEDPSTIGGETNLLPGSRVQVTVASRLAPRFERRTTATVRENGTFRTTIELDDASSPGLFAVTVAGEQYPGVAGDPPAVHWDVEQAWVSGSVDQLDVEHLRLPDGGFLVAYAYDRETGELDRVGVGTTTDTEFEIDAVRRSRYLLVVAHRDADDDWRFRGLETDPPYRVDGQPVAEWLPIRVQDDGLPRSPPDVSVDAALNGTTSHAASPTPGTARATPTAGTPRTATSATATGGTSPTTPSPTTDRTPTTAGHDPTETTTPGFGLLAAALALVAGLALAAGLALDRRPH